MPLDVLTALCDSQCVVVFEVRNEPFFFLKSRQKMSYARGYVSSADAGDHGDLPPGARGPPAQRGSVAVVPLYNEDRRGPPVAVGLSPPVAQGTRRMRPLMCRVNRCNQSSTSRLRAHASRSGIHVQEGERERGRGGVCERDGKFCL